MSTHNIHFHDKIRVSLKYPQIFVFELSEEFSEGL